MKHNPDNQTGTEIKKVVCWASPGCVGFCGLLVGVKDDKIISMKSNPQHPNSRGHVCKERFPYLLNWLNHRDQLMHPLKRIGERGENKWKRISWDTALDEIAEKLVQLKAQYGAESLAVTEGTLRSDMYGIRSRFLNLFGNPGNISTPGTVCNCNKVALSYALAGAPISPPANLNEAIRTVSCLVFCGLNLSDQNPLAWQIFKNRLQKGPKPKVIVIDPRRTQIAEKADIWLQIRPGTDAALYLGWLHLIIKEELYDKDFVDKWTSGFELLKERVVEYTPERVAEITWLPADKIRESAHIYATARPAYIHPGNAADEIGLNGIRVEQARLCLHAVTGNMAVIERPLGPGPIINGKIGIRDAMLQLEENCSAEQRKKQIGSDRFKLMTWPAYEITSKYYKETYGVPQPMSGHNMAVPQPLIWRAIVSGKPYPIKAMITWGSNPLLNAGNTKLVYQALKSSNLDLHVVLEHFMTPTALLADYVMPIASKLEKPRCCTFEDFDSVFICGERAIKPLGERRTDYEFFRGLATRLGLGEYFPWKTDEELADYRLKPLEINFKLAATERYFVAGEPWIFNTINPRTGKPTGFATPTGKFELYSNVLKELGYDPLPFYEEPAESPLRTPDIAQEYPLILTTGGRFLPQFHSEHRQFGMGLREQHPEPLADIHPDTAKDLDINEGDWIYIETRRGVIKQKAKLNNGIHPKVINIEGHWWFPEQPASEPSLRGLWQSNCNVLTMDDPDTCDPISGGWSLRALLCKVYKVS